MLTKLFHVSETQQESLQLQTCPELSALHADVQSLQQPDGSFAGDAWGEIDTRCSTADSADMCLTQEQGCPAA